MAAPRPTSPGARQGSVGRCPSCGQPLRTQRAVRLVRKSRLEFDGVVDAAVKARLAELVGELAAEVEAERREALERPEARAGTDVKRRVEAEAHHAEELDKLRMTFRQF